MLASSLRRRAVNDHSNGRPAAARRGRPAGGSTLTVSRPVTEFVRFGVVGILATVTHVLVFYATSLGLGLHPTLATTVAFAAAVGISYSLNRG